MFYSQTFLARKGPLGTVWCAAHMQSRLKKSHYTSTDIPSTVDRIMFPEVPLALRMSSHLLLGVVRIYAKQVEILYDDCNVALVRLRKAFASIDLNLPEDARQAPVQTITLPDTFNLDAMDLDDGLDLDGAVDHHLRNQEDITILDQIPCETELYVCINFDEDIMMDSQHSTTVHDSSALPEDQNVVPPTPGNNNEGVPSPSNDIGGQERLRGDYNGPDIFDAVFQDPGPSDLPQMHDSRRGVDNPPDVIPEIEVMRDAGHLSTVHPHILSPNRVNDTVELLPSVDQLMTDKETISPILENNLPAARQTPVVQTRSESQVSLASLQEGLANNSPVSFAIKSTPRVQEPEPEPKPKQRPRKRKQLYDEAPVLTNKFMKKALKDTSELVRKRTKIPHSSLGIWKLKNKLRKEKVFIEPSTTGLCSDLCDIFNDGYMSTKLKSSNIAQPDSEFVRSPGPTPEAQPDYEFVRSPGPAPEAQPDYEFVRSPGFAPEASPHHENTEFQTPARDDDIQEIELLRHAVSLDQRNTLPETIPSPIVTPSITRDDASPSLSRTFRSTPPPVMEMDTPSVFSEEQTGREYTFLTDIPEANSEIADDLFFLEADNSTPGGASQGIQSVNCLSVRTRAVAQYLKRQSPITPFSGDLSEPLSLNKLLQGKTRKLCARMFFETLVLRSNDLVDMEQQEPYGEITVTLTPALSKAQF